MSKLETESPEHNGELFEIELPAEGSMEAQILKVVIDALNDQGYPGLSSESLRDNSQHRAAAIDMLRDCRPMPVIRGMIEKIEDRQL
jgi:hypothetical protein